MLLQLFGSFMKVPDLQTEGVSDYSSITELPGNRMTAEQIDMINCRYYTAGKFVDGKDVLEVACGAGLGLDYIKSKGARRIVGGDYTKANLEIASKEYDDDPQIELIWLDAHDLPFENDSFDVILLFEAIFYFQNAEKCLSEFSRVLRKGGKLILCLPNCCLDGFIPSKFSTKYFTVTELTEALRSHFQNVKIFGAYPIPEEKVIQKLRVLRIMTAKAFNIIPKATQIKEWLKKYLMGKNIILSGRIRDVGDDFTLTPLNPESIDTKHQLIYAHAERL